MSQATRSVVITGAGSGFGKATAVAFAAAGWRTYATLRDPENRNSGPAAELRALGAHPVALDVTDDASVERAAALIARETGAVDVLVNNAGNAYFGAVEGFTPAALRSQFETNVFGPQRVTRAFLGAMREKRRGLIVYVSSVVGRFVLPFGGVYTASKWALEALAESASYELRPFGVDVALVEPGAYETNIGSATVAPDDVARADAYTHGPDVQGRIFKRLLASAATRSADEVAHAILALAQAPAGQRPLRTLVGGDEAVTKLNASTGAIQRAILESFGIGELLGPEAVPA